MDSANTHSEVAGTPEVTPLLVPAEGIPPIIHSPSDLPDVVNKLLAGEGPIAVDAERASGYKYSQRAYLIQIRRKGSGIFLIDPIACPDLSSISNALHDCEWIIHASTQDLACLREVGISPTSLFDTELGARIAGFERVGLGALIELLLHRSLAKEHSAVDWSTRPLPEPWLNYAALDVELLVELRDEVESVLRESGKLEWAQEEFASVLTAPPSPPREEPWRRTSGLHQVKKRRALAIVKFLWTERDGIAQSRDIAPGRILPDSAIVAAALNPPTSAAGLMSLRAFHGRGAEKYVRNWWSAIERALAIPEDELPEHSKKSDGPPPPKVWIVRNPLAHARLSHARAGLKAISEEWSIPIENLLTPDTLRRLCWEAPKNVAPWLLARGTRKWQVSLLEGVLREALLATEPLPDPEPAAKSAEDPHPQ